MIALSDFWYHIKTRKPDLVWRDLQFWWHHFWYGYDDSDLWDLDTHLADLILVRLRRFRHMKRWGVPGFFCDPNDETPGDLDKAEAAWNTELDKMIAAFALMAESNINTPEEEKIIEDGLESFKTYFRALWD